MQIGTATVDNSMAVSQKKNLKMEYFVKRNIRENLEKILVWQCLQNADF